MFPSDCPQNRDKEIIVRVAGNYGKTFLSGNRFIVAGAFPWWNIHWKMQMSEWSLESAPMVLCIPLFVPLAVFLGTTHQWFFTPFTSQVFCFGLRYHLSIDFINKVWVWLYDTIWAYISNKHGDRKVLSAFLIYLIFHPCSYVDCDGLQWIPQRIQWARPL